MSKREAPGEPIQESRAWIALVKRPSWQALADQWLAALRAAPGSQQTSISLLQGETHVNLDNLSIPLVERSRRSAALCHVDYGQLC